MRSKSFKGMACSIAGTLEAIGDRWAVLILRDLMFGLSKYEDLRRSTGVTHATLSDRLRHLEENELIDRRRYQSNPERYEYVPPRNSGMRVGPRRVIAKMRIAKICRAQSRVARAHLSNFRREGSR